jgi:hypothetical protein
MVESNWKWISTTAVPVLLHCRPGGRREYCESTTARKSTWHPTLPRLSEIPCLEIYQKPKLFAARRDLQGGFRATDREKIPDKQPKSKISTPNGKIVTLIPRKNSTVPPSYIHSLCNPAQEFLFFPNIIWDHKVTGPLETLAYITFPVALTGRCMTKITS